MKSTLAAIVVATLVSWSFAQQAPPATRPAGAQARVDALLKQLGADKWEERQAAQESLVELGPGVLADLQKMHRATSDEEVRIRCDAAIKQIMQANHMGFVQFTFTPNEDVIAEKHRTANDPGVTSGIDIGGSCFLSESEAQFRSAGRGHGLPDNGRVGNVQLLPYNQKNVARRTDGTPINIDCTPGRYSSVTFYACAGSDTIATIPGATVTATVNYANGAPGSATFLISDWGVRRAGDTYLVEHADCTVWSQQGTLATGWEHRAADWAIFSIAIPTDPTRKLTSIKLTRTGNQGIVNLFAVSGDLADPIDAPPAADPASTQPVTSQR